MNGTVQYTTTIKNCAKKATKMNDDKRSLLNSGRGHVRVVRLEVRRYVLVMLCYDMLRDGANNRKKKRAGTSKDFIIHSSLR
jgi:hypothetical protein